MKYMYATAQHLNWSYRKQFLDSDGKKVSAAAKKARRKRVTQKCKDALTPGNTDGSAPPEVLPKAKKPKDPNAPKEPLTAYQAFVKETLAEMKDYKNGKYKSNYRQLSAVGP